MHIFIKNIPYLFLLKAYHSRATPIAQGGAIANPCVINDNARKSYTITSQKDVDGPAQQLPYACEPNTRAMESGVSCFDEDSFF